ncbi:MAG TPA: hypothetical protein PKY31_11065 [Spirochaetota bacterium]|nr:hypothetical protein [Spirochaetota bacterium]
MRRIIAPLLLFALVAAVSDAAPRKPVVAFGYLANETENAAFGFIEVIFPKSFAHSIANRYDVEVRDPVEVEAILKKSKQSLKKSYNYVELPELVDAIKAEVFINGSYAVMKDNRIRVSLNIFTKGSNEVFTFTNIDRMETDISKIVDRVSVIIMNYFEEDSYRAHEIALGSRFGILTNLDNLELNRLYGAFMKRNCPVAALQGNHLRTYLGDKSIESFKYMRTGGTSFAAITDWRKIKLHRGTWSGPRRERRVELVKRVYRVFENDYPEIKWNILDNMEDAFRGNMDYLMIIGFSGNRNSAWVRCVDVRAKDFVWMRDGYRAGKGDPVTSIADRIIDSMTAPVKNPFQAGASGEK